MNKQIKEFNELMSKAGHYLESELSYSLSTVGAYRRLKRTEKIEWTSKRREEKPNLTW